MWLLKDSNGAQLFFFFATIPVPKKISKKREDVELLRQLHQFARRIEGNQRKTRNAGSHENFWAAEEWARSFIADGAPSESERRRRPDAERHRAAVCKAESRGTRLTMVSPLVKGTPDYRSGVLPSAANLQESASSSSEAPRVQTDR